MRVRCALVVVAAACSGRHAESPQAPAVADAPVVPPPSRVAWALTWRGQAIGGAWERDTEDHFERRERIVVRRGEDVVISDLAITIERDPAGAPFQVGVTRWQDGPVLDGTAMRSADGGWSVEIEGEQPTQLPTAAPFELVLREGQDFHGDVLLAGWGFAVAHLDLVPAAKVATLYVGGRPLHAEITYDDDRAIASIIGGDGVVARRAPLDADLRPTEPPEVVDGNAIALTGSGSTIAFPDATAPPLPSLPGQRPVSGHPWTVALDPSAESRLLLPELRTRDRTAEIAQLVHQVAVTVIDDLSTTATTTAAARVATHGDCTTHALRFAALAADAGIPVRVVTGLRLDGASLIRHRWNVAWTGTRWITIDPTFDEAPATPALIGLAVHGARAADLAAADATVFDGLGSRAELR